MFQIGQTISNRVIKTVTKDNFVLKCSVCGMEDIFSKAHVEFCELGYHDCWKEIKRKQPRFYNIWRNMFSRMRESNCKDFYDYGGRGLGFEYEDLIEFYVDFIDTYLEHVAIHGKANTTIDKDNDLGYVKGHIHWATREEQSINRKNTRHLIAFDHNGTVYLAKGATTFARKVGLHESVIFDYWRGRGSGQGWCFKEINAEQYKQLNYYYLSEQAKLHTYADWRLKEIAEREGIAVDSDNLIEQIVNCVMQRKAYEMCVYKCDKN